MMSTTARIVAAAGLVASVFTLGACSSDDDKGAAASSGVSSMASHASSAVSSATSSLNTPKEQSSSVASPNMSSDNSTPASSAAPSTHADTTSASAPSPSATKSTSTATGSKSVTEPITPAVGKSVSLILAGRPFAPVSATMSGGSFDATHLASKAMTSGILVNVSAGQSVKAPAGAQIVWLSDQYVTSKASGEAKAPAGTKKALIISDQQASSVGTDTRIMAQ